MHVEVSVVRIRLQGEPLVENDDHIRTVRHKATVVAVDGDLVYFDSRMAFRRNRILRAVVRP